MLSSSCPPSMSLLLRFCFQGLRGKPQSRTRFAEPRIFRSPVTNAPFAQVTNIVLFAVTPLYTLFNLSHLVFLITLSPSGLPKAGAEVTTIRSADLAQKVIENLLVFLIFAVLLFLSFNRASWDFESTHTTRESFPLSVRVTGLIRVVFDQLLHKPSKSI